MAPVALNVSSRVRNSDGTQPPALREIRLDLDRRTAVNAVGLAVCGRGQLEKAGGMRAARAACRKAIVGAGFANVMIESLGPRVIRLPLTLFNGGVRGGTTTLFGYSSIAQSNPASTIATVKVKKVDRGRFGLEAVADIPRIANDEGSVLDFSFTIKRLFTYSGSRSSYALARCADGYLYGRITSLFADRTRLSGTVVRSCMPTSR